MCGTDHIRCRLALKACGKIFDFPIDDWSTKLKIVISFGTRSSWEYENSGWFLSCFRHNIHCPKPLTLKTRLDSSINCLSIRKQKRCHSRNPYEVFGRRRAEHSDGQTVINECTPRRAFPLEARAPFGKWAPWRGRWLLGETQRPYHRPRGESPFALLHHPPRLHHWGKAADHGGQGFLSLGVFPPHPRAIVDQRNRRGEQNLRVPVITLLLRERAECEGSGCSRGCRRAPHELQTIPRLFLVDIVDKQGHVVEGDQFFGHRSGCLFLRVVIAQWVVGQHEESLFPPAFHVALFQEVTGLARIHSWLHLVGRLTSGVAVFCHWFQCPARVLAVIMWRDGRLTLSVPQHSFQPGSSGIRFECSKLDPEWLPV